MSIHLCVPLPTSGLPPNQPSTGQPTLCRAVRVSQGSSAEDEADGPQPQLPTSSEQLRGVVSSSSQETEPQCPRSALAAFSFLPRSLPHPPFGGGGSPQKEQVLPQLRLCSREPQTVVHATPPNRKAGAITHRNDDVTHTRAHPPTFSIFTCPLMVATQVGCADVKKQARKRTILERVPAHIHTTGRCPDVGVMRSKPRYLAFLGKRGAVCFLGALKWLLGEWGL